MMIKYLLIPFLALFLSSCQATTPPEKPPLTKPVSSTQDMLNKNLSKWKQADIASYTYEFQRSCFCVREYTKPVQLRVNNGAVVEARFKDTNERLPDRLEGNKQTIANLFTTIQKAIDRKAHSIVVQYDEEYGFPTSISVDYDQRMADEE